MNDWAPFDTIDEKEEEDKKSIALFNSYNQHQRIMETNGQDI